MGRPVKAEKEYQANEMRQATFRIEHGKLTAFHRKCEEMGSNATEVLTAYIERVISGDEVPSLGNGLDDSAIAALRTELENMIDAKVEDAVKKH